MAGITIYRVEDGKITEAWSSYDELGMLQQVGVSFALDESAVDDVDPDSEFGMVF